MPLREIPDLKARELLSLVKLAEYGSFMAAAAALEISQPTLSRIVQRVERVMGARLLTRSTRRLEFTSVGEQVVAVARRTLDDLQLTLRHVGEVTTEQRGQVIVSTYPIFAQLILPKIIRRYRETRPQVQIHLRHGRHPEILEQICSGVADFGIAYVLSVPDTVRRVDLWRDPLCVILPGNHPLASRKTIKLANLRGVPLVSLPEEFFSRRLIDGAAARAGFSLQHAVTAPGFMDVIYHVRAGVGAGIVPRRALGLQGGFEVRPLTSPSLSMSVALISLRTRNLTPAASSLMEMVLEGVRSCLTRNRKRG